MKRYGRKVMTNVFETTTKIALTRLLAIYCIVFLGLAFLWAEIHHGFI